MMNLIIHIPQLKTQTDYFYFRPCQCVNNIQIDLFNAVPTISAYTWWNRQSTNDTCKSRSLLSWQSDVRLSGFSASGQFAAAEMILNSTSKPLRRRLDRTQLLLLLMAGDIHPNPGPTAKYPCPVCARDVTSRGVSYRCTRCTGWVHPNCSGLLNAAQYRINKDPATSPTTTLTISNPCSICQTN